jgi:hypothetical protein
MKKLSLNNKLSLTKETLSKLDLINFKGGDDAVVMGMSMVDSNTKYIGCGVNVLDGVHFTRRKCGDFTP